MCAGMSFCAMGDAGGIGMERTRRREGEIVFVNLIRCFLDNVLRGWRGLLPVFVRGDVKVCCLTALMLNGAEQLRPRENRYQQPPTHGWPVDIRTRILGLAGILHAADRLFISRKPYRAEISLTSAHSCVWADSNMASEINSTAYPSRKLGTGSVSSCKERKKS